MPQSAQEQKRVPGFRVQPTTRLADGGPPQAGQTPSPTGCRAAGRERRRGPREMHLHGGGDQGVLGELLEGDGIGEHVRDHLGALGGAGGGDPLERGAGGGRHVEPGGEREHPVDQRHGGGPGHEAGAVERRHGVAVGAVERLLRRQRRRLQAVLRGMLRVGEPGEEAQVGREVVALGQRPVAPGAAGEEVGRVGKPHERRLRDDADGGGIGVRRAGLLHSLLTNRTGHVVGARRTWRATFSPARSRPARSCR